MRLRFTLIASVLIGLASCVEENPMEPQASGVLVEKEFSTSAELSKVYLQENGTSLSWSADDCISVWDGVANRKFTIKEFDGSSATFVGQVDENATDFFAVYPYSDQLAISAPEKEDRDIRIRFPFKSEQTAVPGSIADGTCVAVARTQGSTLDFINRNAMLKFSLDESFDDVTMVTIESASNYISGTYNIEWAGTNPVLGIAYTGRGKTITLSNDDNSPLQTGVDYYVVLPPNNNDGGFSVSMTLADGSILTKTSTKAMAFNSGTIVPLSKTPLTKSMFVSAQTSGRYAAWSVGTSFDICGVTYASSTHGAGTFIAKDQTATISAGGVYFVEDGANVTLGTSTVEDIVIIGNDPAVKSKVTFSGFYLKKDADVACLGVDFRPVEAWPSGKDIINETTAAGDIRFEDCRLYHPSNGRYLVYAGMSGEGLAGSFASLNMKNCIYTISDPAQKAYMLNCPLQDASITFEGCTFHCRSYTYIANQFKLISLTNKSQTVPSVKIVGNNFANLSSSGSGVVSYISSGPVYEYMELTGNIFYLPKITAEEAIINTKPTDGKAYSNWYFTGTPETSPVVKAFMNTPSWTTIAGAMTKATEIPFVEPMTFDTGTFVRKPAYVTENSSEDLGYDIYLLIGQSNAAGRGYLLEEDKTRNLQGVMQWNPFTESIVNAVQPLNRLSTVRKNVNTQRFNLAGPFAEKIYKETGRKVLLVVNARGETLISAWMKEGDGGKITTYDAERDDADKVGQSVWLNDEAVRVTKQAMKYGTLKGILWHQGCGNSSEGNSKTYLSALKKVVTGLRTDLNAPNVPFVAGQLAPEFKNAQYFNPEILKIGDVIDNAYCATSEDCLTIDQTHFDRNSLIKMGERYADIILKQVYGK